MTVCEDMFSRVQEMLPTSSQEAHDYFCRKLSCETDTFDVNFDRERGVDDFDLIDVRSEEAYIEWWEKEGYAVERGMN